MEKVFFEAFVEYGVLSIMLGWTNFMFWKFLKKYIKNTEAQTKVIAENSIVIEQNSKMLKELKETMLVIQATNKGTVI